MGSALWRNRGIAYKSKQDYDNAIRDFDEAIGSIQSKISTIAIEETHSHSSTNTNAPLQTSRKRFASVQWMLKATLSEGTFISTW